MNGLDGMLLDAVTVLNDIRSLSLSRSRPRHRSRYDYNNTTIFLLLIKASFVTVDMAHDRRAAGIVRRDRGVAEPAVAVQPAGSSCVRDGR